MTLNGIERLRNAFRALVDAEGLRPLAARTGIPVGQIRSLIDGRAVRVTTLELMTRVLGVNLTIGPGLAGEALGAGAHREPGRPRAGRGEAPGERRQRDRNATARRRRPGEGSGGSGGGGGAVVAAPGLGLGSGAGGKGRGPCGGCAVHGFAGDDPARVRCPGGRRLPGAGFRAVAGGDLGARAGRCPRLGGCGSPGVYSRDRRCHGRDDRRRRPRCRGLPDIRRLWTTTSSPWRARSVWRCGAFASRMAGS